MPVTLQKNYFFTLDCGIEIHNLQSDKFCFYGYANRICYKSMAHGYEKYEYLD